VSDDHRGGGDDWLVGLRVWIERAGQALLGPGRAELLEHIQQRRSISAAARAIGMSYRHAWLLVQKINQAASEPLIEAATGGSHGGGARLTPAGQHALAVYQRLQEGLYQSAEALLARLIQEDSRPTLHVAAAVSLEEVLGQLLADYALGHPEVRVRTIFGASDELADHLLSGSRADLFLSADPRQLDRLEAAHLLEPGSRCDLAANSLAALALDHNAPPVRTLEALARQKSLRVALADPATPLGFYTRASLEERGLFEQVLARAVLVENSRAVVTMVQSGRADAGLAYGSDAERARGCRVLFRVRRLPEAIRYTAAILCHTRSTNAAREFLDFLLSRSATRCFRLYGFLAAGA
jgi:molybdate transport system substrate-binding protein